VTPAGGASVVDVMLIIWLLASAPAGMARVVPVPSRLTVPPLAPVGSVTVAPFPTGWPVVDGALPLLHQTSDRDITGSKMRIVRLRIFMRILHGHT